MLTDADLNAFNSTTCYLNKDLIKVVIYLRIIIFLDNYIFKDNYIFIYLKIIIF